MSTAKEIALSLKGKSTGNGWQACCPAHRDEKPSLSISEGRAGKVLLRCHAGCSFEKISVALKQKGIWGKLSTLTFGDEPVTKSSSDKQGKYSRICESIWRNAKSLDHSDSELARLYLKRRRFNLKQTITVSSLRFHPEIEYRGNGEERQMLPAILGKIVTPDGTMTGLQRIYLSSDGSKADVENSKKSLGEIAGNAVHFGRANDTVCVTEGIETGLAVFLSTGMPVWAAITASGMENIRIPASIRTVHIFADLDRSGTGQRVAEALGQRLLKSKHTVHIRLPKGIDWNDELILGGAKKIKKALREAVDPVAASSWAKPVKFGDVKLPTFPIDAFPKKLGRYTVAQSESVNIAPDFVAGNVLGAISSCCAKVFDVRTKSDWNEPIQLWILSALESGNRKSTVVSNCFSPIKKWEERMSEKLEDDVRAATINRKTEEAIIDAKRRKLSKSDSEKIEELKSEVNDLECKLTEIPVIPRITVDDVTAEGLAQFLERQNERASIFSSEGGIFNNIGGRYSNKIPNLDIFVKGYSGEAYSVDRKSTLPISLRKPAITFCISPQPYVLKTIAEIPGAREQGLLGRFLYILPDSKLGHRDFDTNPIGDELSSYYSELLTSLLDFSHAQLTSEDFKPILLRFGADSTEVIKKFYDRIERNLNADGKLFRVKEWGSKLTGSVARIAAILHITSNYRNLSDIPTRIPADTVARAIKIGNFLVPHGLKAFEVMTIDPVLESAQVILGWIKRKRKTVFTRRDCHAENRSRFKTAKELDAPLEVLSGRYYIRPLEEEKVSYRPSVTYEVNPAAFEED